MVLKHKRGVCDICGKETIFLVSSNNLKESLACLWCHAILRKRYLASHLVRIYSKAGSNSLRLLAREKEFQNLSIYLAETSGPLYDELCQVTGLISAEFMEGADSGQMVHGIRCENMEHLSFGSQTIDLIIHTSVMEHVRKPINAFEEMYRILKPKGLMLFEVPMTTTGNAGIRTKTIPRVDVSKSEDKVILPPVYHGDPMRSEGALVYNDFGLDIIQQLEGVGFTINCHPLSIADSLKSHCVVFECKKP
jgi:SAM-dependent methyltransferase